MRARNIQIEVLDYLREYRTSRIKRIKLFSRSFFEKVKAAASKNKYDLVMGWSFGGVVAMFAEGDHYALITPLWPGVKILRLTPLERLLIWYHDLDSLLDEFKIRIEKATKENKKVIIFLPPGGVDEKIEYKAVNEMRKVVDVRELPRPGHKGAIADKQNIEYILHSLEEVL